MGNDWENNIDSRYILSKNLNNNKRSFYIDFCEDYDLKGETNFEIREKDIYFYPIN